MNVPSFQKIFAIGQPYVQDIMKDYVEITEKVDGSAFSFGVVDGALGMRSKRAMLYGGESEKMFEKACDYVLAIQEKLPDGIIFHAEYLQKPKHNALSYSRIPNNHLALYGVRVNNNYVSEWVDLQSWATKLGIDVVPLIYYGQLATIEALKGLLDRESYLGGVNIEGIVIKNYHRQMRVADQFFPIMCAKYVSEAFKERSNWREDHTNVGKWDRFKESFRSEARWMKAINAMREEGKLLHDPKDIGDLIRFVQHDIVDEDQEDIKEFLWQHFGKEILRISTSGLPEFYKNYLMEGTFDGQ